MKYSISQAHRITNKSRTTIAAHIESSKLSFEKDPNGNRVIDASELIRVYGDDCDFDQVKASRKKTSIQKRSDQPRDEQSVQNEPQYVQQQLDREITEREREREQYQSQIEHLQEALRLAQEGHNKATLLLEHRSSGVGDWENSLQMLKTQLANHEEHSRKERDEIQNISKRQIAQYKRAYDEEKSKSIWQKLFG